MKPRNREVNIFNMSVLDLLTGALGAFCFLTLALFPSYFKVVGGSAADKAAEAKAAQALKEVHVKLESELASAKANQNGMPPFAMAFVTMSNPQNTVCGAFQVASASGPGGEAAVKMLPNYVQNGYDLNLNMFLLAPGTYNLSLTAHAQSLPCTIYVFEYGASGTQQVSQDLSGTALTSYNLNFDVQAADLQFAQVFKN
ncbi:MAG TPA: hypothetical protein VGG60_04205 [Candidatus Binataceae bacterium]